MASCEFRNYIENSVMLFTLAIFFVHPLPSNAQANVEFCTSTNQALEPVPLRGLPLDVDTSPDGMMVAVATSAGAWLYHVEDRLVFLCSVILQSSSNNNEVRNVSWSPDGRYIAIGLNGKAGIAASVWELESGQIVTIIGTDGDLSGDGGAIHLSWAPHQNWVALINASMLKVWSMDDGSFPLIYTEESSEGSPGLRSAIAWSPNGQLLAIRFDEYSPTIDIWNTQTWEIVHQITSSSNLSIGNFSLSWSPDNTMLAAGSVDTLDIWETTHWQLIKTIQLNQFPADLSWSSDSTRIAVAGIYFLDIFDLKRSEPVMMFEEYDSDVWNIAWARNDTRLISVRLDDSTVRLWNSQTGHQIQVIRAQR